MNRIHFEVLGNPQAQKRHRTGKWGRYDPSASDKADFLALCRDNAPDKPIEGAVILRLVFWMPVPKRATKRFKVDVEDFDIYIKSGGTTGISSKIILRDVAHTKARFDIDNQIKFVMDALAGVYWQNDGQVQIGWAYKIYSHRPRTEIEIIY
ncbi:MAG: RusA family crossover junction endodeoxyribonuclease [Dehalococcoidia bacterium]|nr:MAG: RusA family crossover junction endodeoxyribonuclease [Dehalococcoidia bacterium]